MLVFRASNTARSTTWKDAGHVVTGDLVRNATVNMTQLASAPAEPASKAGTEINPNRRPVLRPPVRDSGAVIEQMPAAPLAPAVGPTPNFRGFTGLTHYNKKPPETAISFLQNHRTRVSQSKTDFVLDPFNSAPERLRHKRSSAGWCGHWLSLNFFGLPPELTGPPVSWRVSRRCELFV